MRVGFEKIKIWNVSCFRLGFYHLLSVDAADKVLFNDIILALSKFTVHIFAKKKLILNIKMCKVKKITDDTSA